MIATAAALWHLEAIRAGLTIEQVEVGAIPVTVFRPNSPDSSPVVVIAHGFAGSQQLMQPFAVTLARNGYLALTFDFPGHGRHPVPLQGGIADDDARSRELLAAIDAVVGYGLRLPGADGRVAVLGHSMASDIVVRYAQAHPEVAATVAVSLFSRGVTEASPRNLLVVDGALEPAMLVDEGLRIVGMATDGQPVEGTTYGSFADGTARRLVLADGVEHIGVLYSAESMAEARDWLDRSFGRTGSGFVDARGPWLGLLIAGLVILALPLSRLLPQVSAVPVGAGLPWRLLLPAAIAPAVLTPLILWTLPTSFLPILLGDYLVVHFAIYGVITALGIWLAGGWTAPAWPWRRLAVAIAAVAAYGIVVIGVPVDRYVSSFLPTAGRVPLILAMLAGTLPYFLADEWLTRGEHAAWGSYAVTKLCFLLSLALAIALSLERLFFLIIIVPAILLLFLIYGLLSSWSYGRTGHPFVAGAANALVFAWAIGVTFPVVAQAA